MNNKPVLRGDISGNGADTGLSEVGCIVTEQSSLSVREWLLRVQNSVLCAVLLLLRLSGYFISTIFSAFLAEILFLREHLNCTFHLRSNYGNWAALLGKYNFHRLIYSDDVLNVD